MWVRRERAEHLCERGNYDDALAFRERIPSPVLLFRFFFVVFFVGIAILARVLETLGHCIV